MVPEQQLSAHLTHKNEVGRVLLGMLLAFETPKIHPPPTGLHFLILLKHFHQGRDYIFRCEPLRANLIQTTTEGK